MDIPIIKLLNYYENCYTEPYKVMRRRKYYKRLRKLKENKLFYIHDLSHLALLVNMNDKFIKFLIINKDVSYTKFIIPKKNGDNREINAPLKELKYLQRWILDNILYKIDPGHYAHGFLPGKSIVSNASKHIDKEIVFNIDLKDYFPSIGKDKIFSVFSNMGYNNFIANDFANICTLNNCLPQGSPASPMLANLVTRGLDEKLGKFCENRGFSYSRYADDITISGSKKIPRLKRSIFRIIRSYGFEINEKKIRIQGRGSKQTVTGLIVNEKVSVGKEMKMRLKAIINNIEKNGPVIENRDNLPFFKEQIKGYLSLVKMVEPIFANSLIERYNKIDWKPYDDTYLYDIKSELTKRTITKAVGDNKPIPFNKIECFLDIGNLPRGVYPLLKENVDLLREKCGLHSVDKCRDCVGLEDTIDYDICLKHIIGYLTTSTGGHHHGHEQSDLIEETTFEGKKVTLGILLKAGRLTPSVRKNLFIQFFDATHKDMFDIISIVNNYHVEVSDSQLRRIKLVMKANPKKMWCLIFRTDVFKIYNEFLIQKYCRP